MDTITQSLLGAVTAQLGFRQRLGRGATWVAAGAALVPDLDVFAGPVLRATGFEAGGLGHWVTHRGLSHSLLLVPILALPIAALWWWVRTRRRKRPPQEDDTGGQAASGTRHDRPAAPFSTLYACVFVALASHPLLDWCTSYGTQLLAPMSRMRFAADCVPIIDIFYTPLLALTLVGCLIVRKVKRLDGPRASLAVGWIGFGLSVAYLASGWVLHERAVEVARGLAKGETVVQADAYPALGSIFLWRTVVETTDEWQVARVRPLAADPAATARVNVVPDVSNRWTWLARAVPEGNAYEWFAMGRIRAAYRRVGDRHFVELHDMRYGPRPESAESLWPLHMTFEADELIPEVKRLSRRGHQDVWGVISEAWRDLWAP